MFVLNLRHLSVIAVSKYLIKFAFSFLHRIVPGKTSHQAISHRVKSITMSNWTLEEVNELSDQRGGGNNAALHNWLKNSPSIGQRLDHSYLSTVVI